MHVDADRGPPQMELLVGKCSKTREIGEFTSLRQVPAIASLASIHGFDWARAV
jgi:hypothetical protein